MTRHALFALSLLSVGCGPALPAAPLFPTADDGFAEAAVAPPPGMDEPPPTPAVLVSGDRLHLRVVSVRPLELDALAVDASGRVTLPFVGAVEVAGLPLDVATLRVEEALRPVDRHGRVILELREARSRRASVVGAVERPGRVDLDGELRLADLLALAGGPARTVTDDQSLVLADLGAARLVRDGVALPVSVPEALVGDPRHNVRVEPADLLFVPESGGTQITVLGEVSQPGTVPYRPGMRLTEVLARSGGTTHDADDGDVRVLRGALSAPRVYRASLSALVDGQAPDVVLAPGDVIYVSREALADLGEVLSRVAPLLGGVALLTALASGG